MAHREKLEEIRNSLKDYKHENGNNAELRASHHDKPPPEYTTPSSSSIISKTKLKPTTSHADQHQYYSQINGNSDPLQVSTMESHLLIGRQPSPIQAPRISPHTRPPPAYDATPSKRGITPVAPDYVRSHIKLTTSQQRPHQKQMAPAPPSLGTTPSAAKSQILIEPYGHRTDLRTEFSRQQLYHTSVGSGGPSPSIVNIKISPNKPLSTAVPNYPLPQMPISSQLNMKEFTRILMNYSDELRPQQQQQQQQQKLIGNHTAYNFIESRATTSTTNTSTREDFRPTLAMPTRNLDIQLKAFGSNQKPAAPPYTAPSVSTQPQKIWRESNGRTTSSTKKRCVSPLSRLEATRLFGEEAAGGAQQSKPHMFKFYMEQHVERLLQQYREREKRATQLEADMCLAGLKDNDKDQLQKILQRKESMYTRLKRQKMSKDMFTMIRHIGVGAFGKVSLVRKKDTGRVYAMKALEKEDVINKQQAAHVKAERDILAEADSPWIVKLFFSFQDEQCLYFILEYVPGGDMMQLLIKMGVFKESLARFYIAELTSAIEYVHSVGFIHRDIKPDNILIDREGHIKLTDFGLCTGLRWTHDRRYYGTENEHVRQDSFSLPPGVVANETDVKVLNIRHQKKRNCAHSVVGTGDYMAPEVISGSGHTQLCDWWSTGVILYEMVFGRPPFMSMSQNINETRDKILNWRTCLDVSVRAGGGHLSKECISIIKELVCGVETRLGSKGGAAQVREHSWFKGINFNTLRKSPAEFIPKVEHEEDTSNFDVFNIPEPDRRNRARAPNNPAFYEFTYRNFFDTDAWGCPSLKPKRPSLKTLMETEMTNGTGDS